MQSMISPLRGEGDVYAMLEFLKDPKKYKDHLDKLNKLRKDINDLIALTGPVEKIEELLSHSKDDRGKAAYELEQAKIESESIRKKARDYEKAVKDRVKAFEEKSNSDLSEAKLASDEQFKGLTKREKEAEKKYADGEKLLARAVQLETASTKIKEEYEHRVEVLMGAIDQGARA